MPIGNQLMHTRVGTYNFSPKVLKLKIFSSKENNFYSVHCLSKIMAYSVLMLHYFSSICLVTYIFNKLLFLYAVAAYIGKSCNVLLFINDYFRNLPLVALLLKNRQLSNFILQPKWSSCPWFPKGLLNRSSLITTHNFDIICLSETFLDSTVPQRDENIMINGYSFIKSK